MKRIPFLEDEMIVKGEYPGFFEGMPPTPKLSTPITPKENYLAAYREKEMLWLPSTVDQTMVMPMFLEDNVARFAGGGKDFFGIEWIWIEVAMGAMVKPGSPLINDMNHWKEKIVFPNLDNYPWETANETTFDDEERIVSASVPNGLFERLISFMDFEGAALALIDEDQQNAILDFFDRLADFYIQLTDKFIEYYHIDILNFHDDWGSQRAPFFSPETVRKMILPALKKIVDHAHKKKLIFDMHSCGKNEMLTPIYIEAGVDSWSPQTMNDLGSLYKKYGDKIMFSVSPPEMSPDATDEEIYLVAQRFVDQYCHLGKPVSVFLFESHPKMREAIYKLSRIALST
ncbi:MAG: methyltransferase [Eubacteriaceae bacterium]